MIRSASIDDAAPVAKLGESFHREACWADVVPYNAADCEATIRQLIESADGIVLVAENDGEIVGMAAGLAYPMYFNHAHRTGQELFWWVKPGLRDGTGRLLLEMLETEARAIGCLSWTMISLDKVNPEVMARLYRRRGYRASEHSFVKRL